MDEPPPYTGRRYRRLLVVGAVVGVVVAVGLTGYVRWAGDRNLRLAREETTALDLGWQLADLLTARNAAVPVADRNSALVIAAVEKELPGQAFHPELFDASWAKDKAAPNRLPTPAKAEALQAAVRELAGPLAALHTAIDLPGGYEPIPVPDPKTFDFMKLPLPDWARKAGYAAMLDAAAAAARNDPSAALRGVRAGAGVARAMDEPPTNMAVLVRIAVAAVAARSCERVLGWCEPADGLDAVQDDFRREAGVSLARVGLRGERATYDASMDLITAGCPPDGFGEHVGSKFGAIITRPKWTNEHAAGLRVFNRLLKHERPADLRAAITEIEAEYAREPAGSNLLLKLLLPSLDKVVSAAQRHEATQLVAMTAVACERHRRQTGRWPVTLSEVLPSVPTDPFDGQPLRYKRTPEGVVIYSLGENGTDDGGQPVGRAADGKPTGDVIFRLYDPDKRRLPALPPAPEAGR